jgi:ankyrin repeat protein
MGHI